MRTRSALVLLGLLCLAAGPAAAATRVKIDILPGEPGNLVARTPGEVVEVAVLGSDALDATALLPESLRLAGATVIKDDAGATHTLADVNGDGRLDLIVRFLGRDLRVADGATRMVLHGTTREGAPVEGEDAVRTVAGALDADLQRRSGDDEKLPHRIVEVEAVAGEEHALAILGSDEVPAREIVLGSMRVQEQRIGKATDGELATYKDVNGDGKEDLVIAAPPGVETDGAVSLSARTRTGRILGTEATEPTATDTQESAVVLAPAAPSTPFTLFGQNPAVITIPDSGPATPYPSTIQVAGVSGVISKIRVTLERVTHTCYADLDILLVAPTGQSLVLTSDAGGCGGPATPTRLTFDDYAPATLSDAAVPTSGSYRPTNYFGGDPFPAPAPTPTQASAMSVFQGIDPNGTWKLYVFDDAGGDSGSIAGGWTLDLVTSTRICNLNPLTIPDAGASATSWISVSGLPHRMVKATVTLNDLTHGRPDDLDVMLVPPSFQRIMLLSDAGGVGNTVVQMTFDNDAYGTMGDAFGLVSGTWLPVDYEPGESLPAPAPPGAGFTNMGLLRGGDPNGTWQLFIADDTAGSTGSLAGGWCLDVTAIAPMEACAPAAVAIPGIAGNTAGAAAPYPSTIPITGTTGYVESVDVKLFGLSHTYPDDLDMLLQSPSGRVLPILSDAGGSADVTSLDFTITTALSPPVEGPPNDTQLGVGPYYISNYDGFDGDSYPSPAPAPNATGWSDREPANGNWNLWVNDDAAGDTGALYEGWCLGLSLWEPTYSVCTDGAHPITIPSGGTSGIASSYPWAFQAVHDGMSIRKIVVRIENLSHTFPDDLDVLLVGPNGTKAILMSDAGGGSDIVERTLTFDDDDPNALPVPDSGPLATATYHTADYNGGDVDNWFLPGPFFPGIYTFRGTDPRGQWNLYITDDATSDVGGAVRWCIDFYSVYPPGVATRARWLSKNFLIWDVAQNVTEYAVLRGTPADLPSLLTSASDSCNAEGGPGQGAAGLFSEPPPGSFFWYLVQGRNNNGEETGPVAPARIAGTDTPRTVNETGYCPAP